MGLFIGGHHKAFCPFVRRGVTLFRSVKEFLGYRYKPLFRLFYNSPSRPGFHHGHIYFKPPHLLPAQLSVAVFFSWKLLEPISYHLRITKYDVCIIPPNNEAIRPSVFSLLFSTDWLPPSRRPASVHLSLFSDAQRRVFPNGYSPRIASGFGSTFGK